MVRLNTSVGQYTYRLRGEFKGYYRVSLYMKL